MTTWSKSCAMLGHAGTAPLAKKDAEEHTREWMWMESAEAERSVDTVSPALADATEHYTEETSHDLC